MKRQHLTQAKLCIHYWWINISLIQEIIGINPFWTSSVVVTVWLNQQVQSQDRIVIALNEDVGTLLPSVLGRIGIEAIFKFCILVPPFMDQHETWGLERSAPKAGCSRGPCPKKGTLNSFTICFFSFISNRFIDLSVNYCAKKIMEYYCDHCFVWGFSSWKSYLFCCCIDRAGEIFVFLVVPLFRAEVLPQDQSHAAGRQSLLQCLSLHSKWESDIPENIILYRQFRVIHENTIED